MTTNAARPYALQHLVLCGLCWSPLQVKPGTTPPDDVYRCSRSHQTPKGSCAAPDVRARLLENCLIEDVSETIFTPQNIGLLHHYLVQAGYSPTDADPSWLKEAASDPLTYTAASTIPAAQQVFAKFIDAISVNGTEATVHYSIPLHQDDPLPGAMAQAITLPAQVLT